MGLGATGLAGNGMKRLAKYGRGATPSYLRMSRKYDKSKKQKSTERKKAADMARGKSNRAAKAKKAKPNMMKRIFRRRA